MAKSILEYLKENTLILDGGMGTLLQKRGLLPGELPERWNISHSDAVRDIHREYFDAGSNIVCTNTFGANILKFSEEELSDIISAALRNAREAAELSAGTQEKWVALDIGPTGKMLAPYGDLDFEDATEIFAKTVRLGAEHGADLIFIETMSDSYETKAALLAAKENSSLPVFVSNAYEKSGKLMTGADAASMVAMLEGMGADVVGMNCSLGPKELGPICIQYLENASVPVLLKPNAGLPRVTQDGGGAIYDITADEFANTVAELVKRGVRLVGGCCGTTPEYIRKTKEAVRDIPPAEITEKNITAVSSYTHAVVFGDSPVLIGERINPTGKKLFKEALRSGDMDYILREGIGETERGAHILDVNVGLPEIDEKSMLTRAVTALQAVTDTPLQIDTASADAMEAALRRYNGKPMINSVSGKKESMDAIFPLAKKYGGLVVALTLDDNGIPTTAEGRVEIAKRILEAAAEYGIKKKDIIFDPLAMAVSADKGAARETLKAVGMIRRELGCHTSLGISNVSFGLPARDAINSTFFALCLENGLSAAIMNPYSYEMMKTYHAYKVLATKSKGFDEYIEFASSVPSAEAVQKATSPASAQVDEGASELQRAVIKGLSSRAAMLTDEMLGRKDALDIINTEIVPALDFVGKGFESGKIYLPSLLMSAEAAKAAFEEIKKRSDKKEAKSRCSVVIATVKGDIHDIGKNIVKLMLENYGFDVCDLGKDVDCEEIVEKAVSLHAPLVVLSALMTTTVPAMEKAVKALREGAPWCKVMVGGAVMNSDYARAIGADLYARDAMEAVRLALSVSC